jgi:hypothetical protein
MEKQKTKFDLTPFDHNKILNESTISMYTQGETWKQALINSNRQMFDEGKEIVADGFYYGMVTFVEDNFNFCMLTPYLAKRPTYPKRNFAFGGFDTKTNKLFMFFNGVATTNNRQTAIQVYNSLLKYCEWEYPFLLPFAIKL